MFHEFYAAMDSCKYLHLHPSFIATHNYWKDEKNCNPKLHSVPILNEGENKNKMFPLSNFTQETMRIVFIQHEYDIWYVF